MKRRRGFTLIELSVALWIFLFANLCRPHPDGMGRNGFQSFNGA